MLACVKGHKALHTVFLSSTWIAHLFGT